MFPLGIEPRTFLSEASNLTTGLSTLLTKHKIINKKQTYFATLPLDHYSRSSPII